MHSARFKLGALRGWSVTAWGLSGTGQTALMTVESSAGDSVLVGRPVGSVAGELMMGAHDGTIDDMLAALEYLIEHLADEVGGTWQGNASVLWRRILATAERDRAAYTERYPHGVPAFEVLARLTYDGHADWLLQAA